MLDYDYEFTLLIYSIFFIGKREPVESSDGVVDLGDISFVLDGSLNKLPAQNVDCAASSIAENQKDNLLNVKWVCILFDPCNLLVSADIYGNYPQGSLWNWSCSYV